MKVKSIVQLIFGLTGWLCLFGSFSAAAQAVDTTAEKMLVYQRSYGGWPKAVNMVAIDYKKPLSPQQRQIIKADSSKEDATIDNKATSREIVYLVKAYGETSNKKYLDAAERGLAYLFKAQYANGGWPQYYPEHNLYRGEITYNDDAMINVLNIMQDIVEGINGFDKVNPSIQSKASIAVKNGVDCILKTQVVVNDTLTVWCAQYDENTLKPARARAFELISLSGSESVGITEFLMRIKNPSVEIRRAVKSAVAWFEKSKIVGYNFVFVNDPAQPKGKDRLLVKDPSSTIWARFYDIKTNEPFFVGRDSQPKKTIAEVEVERRVGYAWYGTWPSKVLKKYPAWLKLNHL